MSKLTLGEAISRALEEAGEYQEKADSAELIDILDGLDVESCKECAADHGQLAEWLTELKELRNSLGAVKLKDMKDAVGLLQELNTENDQLTSQLADAKRLLKAAVEDFNSVSGALESNMILCMKYIACKDCPFNGENCNKWRYADEAERLLND